MKLAHVCLSSADLEKSEAFWIEALAMRRVFDFTKHGRRVGFYIEAGDGTFIEIFESASSPAPSSALRHFCIETDDLDAVIDHLRAAGFSPTEKKLGCDKTWQFWVDSPEGVRFEFQQYTPQSSQHTGEPCEINW
jgi:catechol 2,3-dioxygenase-like lactoylglutathione lyase family enzyme